MVMKDAYERFQTHTSIFSKGAIRYPIAPSRRTNTVESAASAAQGALWFVVIIQFVVFATLVHYISFSINTFDAYMLVGTCALFNATYWWTWGSSPGRLEPNTPDRRLSSSRSRSAKGEGEENEDGIPLRWCDDCDHWQPLRCKHCDRCGYCVRKYDHHCFWVGCCVGESNHARFLAVLLTATSFIYYSLYWVIQCLRFTGFSSFSSWLLFNALPLSLFITGAFMLIFCGLLLAWHMFLVASNQTTWEAASSSRITFFRYTHKTAPFNRGLWTNLWQLCLSPHPIVWRFTPTRAPREFDEYV